MLHTWKTRLIGKRHVNKEKESKSGKRKNEKAPCLPATAPVVPPNHTIRITFLHSNIVHRKFTHCVKFAPAPAHKFHSYLTQRNRLHTHSSNHRFSPFIHLHLPPPKIHHLCTFITSHSPFTDFLHDRV